jgi:hypothetical protein
MKTNSVVFGSLFRNLGSLLAISATIFTARADITTGLIAHWKFDETSGWNHATLWDDSMWVPGRIGGALEFNPADGGDDDQVVTDLSVVLDNQDTFTFAFWARRLPGPNPFNPRLITPVGNEHWVLWAPGVGVGFYVPAPTPDPPEGAWRHYVVLFDRAASRYSVYVDGVRVVNNATATPARPEPGEVQWVIGHKELLTDHRDPWRGFLDDVRMYNRVLTESDIAELYSLAGAVAPSIVTHPQNTSKFVGDTVTLNVVAEGTGPLRYQWKQGETFLENQTNAMLVITNAQLATSGAYTVVVSNVLSSVQSNPAQVTITDPPVDITTGLVMHYPFDETSGFAVADASGRGNHGSLNFSIGDGSEWVEGRLGGALFLNPVDGGNDDYVVTDNFVTLDNQDQFTFTFWAKLAPGWGVNPRIITPTTGHWVLWQPNTGVGFFVPAASPQPLLDVWRHFAVIYDRAAGTYQLFVDGVRTGAEVSGRSRTAPGESQWVIGHSEALGINADAFTGALDDLRVYNRILSGKDIAALYNLAPSLAPRIISAPTNLIAAAGTRLDLTVVTEGNDLAYQWRKGTTDITAGTNATLTLEAPTGTDSGAYSVVVTNSLGRVESAPATITIVPVLNLTSATAVSSGDFNETFTANKAFDGLRLSTGPNSSRWASPGGAQPQWIYVDLGEDMTLKQVLLDWEAAYGIDYTLRGRTAAQGPSADPFDWTELAAVSGYAQASHGLDGADVVFDFEGDRVVLQSATAEPAFATIVDSAPAVRYLMLDGQTSTLPLFSIWEIQVNATGTSAAPELAVTLGAGGATISWPATVTGYVLESSPTVPSNSWAPVQGVVNNSVTVPPTGTMFYRLRRSP